MARLLLRVLLSLSVVSFGAVKGLSIPEAAECTSVECKEVAQQILSKMDTRVNPCDDFYQFTCGKFLADNENKSASIPITLGQNLEKEVMAVINQLDANSPKYFLDLKNLLTMCNKQGMNKLIYKIIDPEKRFT